MLRRVTSLEFSKPGVWPRLAPSDSSLCPSLAVAPARGSDLRVALGRSMNVISASGGSALCESLKIARGLTSLDLGCVPPPPSSSLDLSAAGVGRAEFRLTRSHGCPSAGVLAKQRAGLGRVLRPRTPKGRHVPRSRRSYAAHDWETAAPASLRVSAGEPAEPPLKPGARFRTAAAKKARALTHCAGQGQVPRTTPSAPRPAPSCVGRFRPSRGSFISPSGLSFGANKLEPCGGGRPATRSPPPQSHRRL